MSNITLDSYQEFTKGKAVYNTDVYAEVVISGHDPDVGEQADIVEVDLGFIYPVLALAEEAGEVAGKVAKYIRKGSSNYAELRGQVLPELGDVAYQLSEAARQFGFTLDDVLSYNMEKLNGRAARGTIVGEGDVR